MKVALVQVSDRHTEIIGGIIEAFPKDTQFDVFHEHVESPYSYIAYFTTLFDEIKEISKNPIPNPDEYNAIVMLTSYEHKHFGDESWKNAAKGKTFGIAHHGKDVMKASHGGATILALSPLLTGETVIKSPDYGKTWEVKKSPGGINWMLPIYDKQVPDSSKKNYLTVVGLSSYTRKGRDTDDFFRMVEWFEKHKPDWKIRVISRPHPSFLNKLEKYPFIEVVQKAETEELIEMVQESKFLLTLCIKDGWYHKDRMSGVLPLAYNNDVPLITDSKIIELYGMEGCVVYDDSIVEVLDKIVSMTDTEYTDIRTDLAKYKAGRIKLNKEVVNDILIETGIVKEPGFINAWNIWE
jgi:hypothetical protein